MKEATSELITGIVVLLAVGVLIAFFYTVLWPEIRENFVHSENCNKAICDKCNSGNCEYLTCYAPGKPHTPENSFQCVNKG